ncbi:MAG: STAS domain-containing protein [Cyanobium sp.]
MDLTITVAAFDSHHLITLTGDVDTKTAPALLDALTALQLASIPELRVEMVQVGFLSSAGLRALVFAKQKMSHSSRLILVGTSTDVAEVIIKTGLDQAITLVADHDSLS